ncbi:MAG: hypothetical protein AAB784_02025 [Patescibacteria group bacterium]
MSKKIKVSLGILLLLAGFLIVRVGLYLKNSVQKSNLASVKGVTKPENELISILKDSDADGIIDYDEAYYRTSAFDSDSDDDGYLDGEEVATGTNPSKKDAVPTQTIENITANFGQRLVAGIYAGDLNPRNGKDRKYEEGLDQLSFAVIDEAQQVLSPSIDNELLNIVPDTPGSMEIYLQTIGTVMEGSFLDAFLSQPQSLNKIATLLSSNQKLEAQKMLTELSSNYATTFEQLKKIPIPKKFLTFHNSLLRTFGELSNNYRSLVNLENDPMLAIVALNNLSTNLFSLQLIIQQFNIILTTNNLTMPDTTLFNVIKLLNN